MGIHAGEQPGLLVAVSGRGAMRMVIASLRINPNGWGNSVVGVQSPGLICILHNANALRNLDYYQL